MALARVNEWPLRQATACRLLSQWMRRPSTSKTLLSQYPLNFMSVSEPVVGVLAREEEWYLLARIRKLDLNRDAH